MLFVPTSVVIVTLTS